MIVRLLPLTDQTHRTAVVTTSTPATAAIVARRAELSSINRTIRIEGRNHSCVQQENLATFRAEISAGIRPRAALVDGWRRVRDSGRPRFGRGPDSPRKSLADEGPAIALAHV
jgi:hypothetical protein